MTDTTTAAMVERMARAIYESRAFYGNDPGKVPWVPGGNSLRQDEARDLARDALAALAEEAGGADTLRGAASTLKDAAAEIERLRAGLMRSVQYENSCDQTGRSCRENEPCACQKEAEVWLEDKR